ncbi:hypothetical protein P692DRAFT_20823862, partial [Suillus brevipes Sb2]
MSEPHAITKLCNIGPCKNVPIDRKHKYQYHSAVALIVQGKKVTVTRSGNGGLECPAVGCDVVINRRTTYQSHMDKREISLLEVSNRRKRQDNPGGTAMVPLRMTTDPHTPTTSDITKQNQVTLPEVPTRHTPQNISFGMRTHTSDSTSDCLAQVPVQEMADDVLSGGSTFFPELGPNIEAQGCKSPLTGDMVVGHLKNKHSHSVASHESDELAKYCVDKNIYRRQEEVRLPAPGGPVIQMISPPRVGIACTLLTDCQYSVCNLDTMKRHAKLVHGRAAGDARYRQVSVQNLFDSVGRSYFAVEPVVSDPTDNLKALLMQNFHPSLDVSSIPEVLTPEERRPLLKVMSWDLFMVDVRRHPKEVKAVEALKGKHHHEEHLGLFKA